MQVFIRSAQRATLFASGAGVAFLLASAPGASAADYFTWTEFTSDEAWENPLNWSSSNPGTLPGMSDHALIGSGFGAVVVDARAVHGLTLDGGLNVHRGGSLKVGSEGIANIGAFFINDGEVTTGTVVNDDYIANTFRFTANVDNHAGIVNDGVPDDGVTALWFGDVVSNTGQILNSNGSWHGQVLSNANLVDNYADGTWTGDVVSNQSQISNEDTSVWNGNVLSNDGQIYSHGTWNGSIQSAGGLDLTGIVNGAIDSSGTVTVRDLLKGVKSFTNTGLLTMQDGAADDRLMARSWSGTGTAALDVELATGRSDRIVLSGNYSAETAVELTFVGPPHGRRLGDIPIVTVGGDNTGGMTVTGLPGDGIVSYRLARSGNDWVIATSLNDAPDHVAGATFLADAMLEDATRVSLPADACGRGGWVRGLGGSAQQTSGPGVDFSGLQMGFDIACLAVPHTGATLGIGVTMGMANGDIGGQASGDVQQSFGGLYADLVDGAFRAILQGQAGRSQYHLSDPGSLLAASTLAGASSSFSGSASYTLALGRLSVVPELGFSTSSGTASSTDFGDVGNMSLASGPELAAHLGATLSADLALDGGLTLTPFAAVSLHGDLITPATTLTDSAGTSASLADGGLGSYVALALGADLVHAGTLDAGLRTDLKLGPTLADTSVSGHAKVSF